MKLYDAIKEIVKLKGKNIITDSALLNYLNDYHAFEDRPASKLVLRDVINGGYSDKILQLSNTQSSWTIKLKSYEHDFTDSCGYKEELVLYVFQSLSYAINLTDKKPGEGMDEVLDFHPFFDEDVQCPTKQHSTPTPKQGNDSVDNKDYLKIAQDFIDKGKLDTARSIAEKIVNGSAKDDENTIKATIMLGHIMRKKEQYKEALDYYNKALNAEANLLKISAKDLQHRITNHEVKDFEDIDIHYMFCLLGIGHIDKNRWTEFVREKAAKGNVTALMYCAQFGIDPQNHIDIFFKDYSKLELGDYLYEDGTFAHEISKLKTVIGKVFTLTTSDLERKLGWTNGCVFATRGWMYHSNEDFYPESIWGPSQNFMFPHTHYTSDDLNHLNSVNSQLYSEILIKDLYEMSGTAFFKARNWQDEIPLTGASNWYLPNLLQTKKLGEIGFLDINDNIRKKSRYSSTKIWTSTQTDKEDAIAFSVNYKLLQIDKKQEINYVVPIFSF